MVSVSSRVLPTSSRCGNLLPSEQMYRENLPHSQRCNGMGWGGLGMGARKVAGSCCYPFAVPMPQYLALNRYVLLSRPFCFEPSTPYEVTMRLQRAGVTQRHPGAFILIDSVRRVRLQLMPEAW